MTPIEIESERRSAIALLDEMLTSPNALQYCVMLAEMDEAVSTTRSAITSYAVTAVSTTRSAITAYAVTLTWLKRGHTVLVLAKPAAPDLNGSRVTRDGAFVTLDPSIVPWWYVSEFIVLD